MDVFVGLDVHLKKTHATIMLRDGGIIKQGRDGEVSERCSFRS